MELSLVQFIIQQARDSKLSAIKVNCAPETSIPFWEHMGFKAYGSHFREKNYRWLKLEYQHPLEEGLDVDLCIQIYPEERKQDDKILPSQEFCPQARQTKDGVLSLDQRITFIQTPFGKDLIVRVTVNQQEICLEKAKHEAAKHLGVESHWESNAFFIDKIHLNEKQRKMINI